MAGIYIHIPFCKQKCSYCDFHFSTTFHEYRQKMTNSIALEIEIRKDYLNNQKLNTIYFGGGTPSLLSEEELQRIIKAVHSNFEVNDGVEVTLEANPDDISESTLEVWKRAGVNRLSIGLQSFKSEDLKWMNRAHTVDEAMKCVSLAQKAGIDNITVDLIYGLPNLSMEEWHNHIQTVIDFGVPHVSAYCLTIENKTALESMVRKGKVNPASEDQQSEQFTILTEMLTENGFEHYEISNFGKPGYESRHNSNYWKGEWYIGVGPSAHSFNGESRSWNISNNQLYMKALENNHDFFEVEELTKEDRFNEYILTGLRTSYGVNLKKLNAIAQADVSFTANCKNFISKDWMTAENNILRLTKEGRLRADYIASELFLV